MFNITIKDDNSIELVIKVKNPGELARALDVAGNASSALNYKYNDVVPRVHVLYLRDCGSEKLSCVKNVKESLCMGLKEAKDICDAVSLEPKQEKAELTRAIDINYLNRLKERIEESGATCFID